MTEEKKVGFFGGKFLPLHQGHIYSILEASNASDELYVILSSSKNRDRELCKRDGIKYIPAEVRLSWLGAALHDLENIKILHIEDDLWDSNYDWEQGSNQIKAAIGKPIDLVFSSEPSYGKHFVKYYPNAKHVIVDDKRKTVQISATELRRNLYNNWDKLPTFVRGYFTKKVALVGTESCGKTTLTKKLAKFFNTNRVLEVGREYCEKFTNQLTPEMFDHIAMEHYLAQVNALEDSNKVLFVDSDAVVTQFYLDMYFPGRKSELVEQVAKLQDYDLVLYLEPDVKWVDDGLRSSGESEIRRKNNERLKQMYMDRGIKFVSLSGNYTERFNRARELVSNLFKGKSLEARAQ
ncbi:MAG: multifunctional transcriptional regulator/nicotinamide-nucleotide adenylyltransferase/ribosylnicotinamide kinase NadR [archaeon]